MNTQKIRKKYDVGDRAATYFRVLSAINDLKLSKTQIKMLAFVATEGELYENGNKRLFSERNNVTIGNINTLMWFLKKQGLLIKKDGFLILNPVFRKLDFTQPLTMEILLDDANQ